MPDHFVNALRSAFAERGDHAALVHQGLSYSYNDLEAKARNVAARLQQLGAGKGDRVVLYTADKLAFLFAHLGVLHAGAVSLPLNPRFTREEMRFFLSDSGASVVVAAADSCHVIEELRSAAPQLRAVISDAEIRDMPRGDFREPVLRAGDPCLILYSSGTTGWPKGVVHDNANVASSLESLRDAWRFTVEDVVVNVLPLFHTHGLSFATHLSLLAGACVIIEDSFHPQETLDVISRGTVFMAVPTIYYRFMEETKFRAVAKSWSHVRLFTCGSAPIRAEVLPELQSILGRPMINRYGMTEAHVITSQPLDGPWPSGSVGLPVAGIKVRIVQEDDQPAPAALVGSVQLRGPNLFKEYWGKPEATRAAFRDGWFDTGDLGYFDAKGFLTLVGRKSDLIITNGFNVYPQVVERVLNECPGVLESAVVGVADKQRGERVAAAIVRSDPTLDEPRLCDFWNERLVDYQRPRTVVFVDQLPRNALGKVVRQQLRDEILKRMQNP